MTNLNTNNAKVFYFNNLKFVKDDSNGYYRNSKTGDRLHRVVWTFYNGAIPKGYQVHHLDQNKNNNNIDNLMLLSAKEHMALHGIMQTEQERQKKRDALDNNARPLAIIWHGSETGRAWHKLHGKDVAEKLKERLITKHCKFCGQEFQDNGFNRGEYCSNVCKSKHRRSLGVDNETRKCIVCGEEFTINKYVKTKTCSRKCANKIREEHKKNNRERRCV